MSAQLPTLHQIGSLEAARRLVLAADGLPVEDVCLLLQDGVNMAAQLAALLDPRQLFGLQMDAELAGVELIAGVQWLDDRQWLALIDRFARCVSW